jgi:hypothetical protein
MIMPIADQVVVARSREGPSDLRIMGDRDPTAVQVQLRKRPVHVHMVEGLSDRGDQILIAVIVSPHDVNGNAGQAFGQSLDHEGRTEISTVDDRLHPLQLRNGLRELPDVVMRVTENTDPHANSPHFSTGSGNRAIPRKAAVRAKDLRVAVDRFSAT